MKVIRTNVQSPEVPFTNCASLSYREINRCPLAPIQDHRWLFEQSVFNLFSSGIGRQHRSLISAMMLINGAPLVTVEPGSIRAKGNQITERRMIVIEITARHGRSIQWAKL